MNIPRNVIMTEVHDVSDILLTAILGMPRNCISHLKCNFFLSDDLLILVQSGDGKSSLELHIPQMEYFEFQKNAIFTVW